MGWHVSERKAKQIAVIDDDDAVRRSLCLVLEHSGYVPLGFANGQNFLDQAPLKLLDGIVLDLEMPVADGATVLSALRAQTHDVPVVVVTGTTEPDLLNAAVGPPVVAVLSKPVGVNDLIAALESGGLDSWPGTD